MTLLLLLSSSLGRLPVLYLRSAMHVLLGVLYRPHYPWCDLSMGPMGPTTDSMTPVAASYAELLCMLLTIPGTMLVATGALGVVLTELQSRLKLTNSGCSFALGSLGLFRAFLYVLCICRVMSLLLLWQVP